MRRRDNCGGKLGLIIHRIWKWRFCKLACKGLQVPPARGSPASTTIGSHSSPARCRKYKESADPRRKG